MSAHSTDRIQALIQAEPWLITQGAYEQILEIANRENTLTPEMISEFQSRPSGREYMVDMYDDTAVLSVAGPVFRYANLFTLFSGAASTETISSEMARLKADDKVKRVIRQYDTPGGMANGASEHSEQIKNFGKPLIGYATGQCCSLGYFWAAQSDFIVVAEDSIVGCIGTKAGRPSDDDDSIVSQHAPAKITNSAALQKIVNSLEAVFHQHVARGRGVSVDHVIDHFGQGGVFIGQEAVDAGLADSVGTLDSILGGNHAANFEVRKKTNLPSQSKETKLMSGDKKVGGDITAEQHEQAITDARQEGEDTGLTKGRAETETAVKAETERCVGILNAGQSKPIASVLPLLQNRAIDVEGAKAILDGIPDETKSSKLSNQMNGSDPKITNNPKPNDEQDPDADNSADVWGELDKDGEAD